MKTEVEILNEFGQIIISEVFDNSLKFIKNDIEDLKKTEEFKDLFEKIGEKELKELRKYSKEILKGALFNFLKIFEENEQFKIYYEKDKQKTNLVEISDMLKSEPIIEGGWIDIVKDNILSTNHNQIYKT